MYIGKLLFAVGHVSAVSPDSSLTQLARCEHFSLLSRFCRTLILPDIAFLNMSYSHQVHVRPFQRDIDYWDARALLERTYGAGSGDILDVPFHNILVAIVAGCARAGDIVGVLVYSRQTGRPRQAKIEAIAVASHCAEGHIRQQLEDAVAKAQK